MNLSFNNLPREEDSIKFKNLILLSIFFACTIIPNITFACNGCISGKSYKHFSLQEDTGYFAREFDKSASAPGLDWDGTADVWFGNAYQRGWVVKSSPNSAKIGALILGYDNTHGSWVGIVREVNPKGIRFEAFNEQNKVKSYEADFDSLVSSYQFLGYIWSEKVQDDTSKKTVSK